MTDQALHRPPWRGSPARRGREASVAIAGSIAFHALVLGYLALRGLSGHEALTDGAIEDFFPGASPPIQVELVGRSPASARPVHQSLHPRTNDRSPWWSSLPGRSRDFSVPESVSAPGRPLGPEADVPRPSAGTAPTGPGARQSPDAPRGRLAPFSGPARTSTLACRSLAGPLTFEEQAICDQRFAMAASGARPIDGTDNPARDARFAAEGQAELDAYEALRAPLKPPTPCEGADMMGRCPFVIRIPLFSRKF